MPHCISWTYFLAPKFHHMMCMCLRRGSIHESICCACAPHLWVYVLGLDVQGGWLGILWEWLGKGAFTYFTYALVAPLKSITSDVILRKKMASAEAQADGTALSSVCTTHVGSWLTNSTSYSSIYLWVSVISEQGYELFCANCSVPQRGDVA